MKSADTYAAKADFSLAVAREQSGQDRTDTILMAQVYATQQGAAATLEAARLTLDAQAANLLSALEESEPCSITWGDADAPCPASGASGGHHCDGSREHPDRCICSCGEMR